MTLLEELKHTGQMVVSLPCVADMSARAAATIESLQKDSANAYDALAKAQHERDELRRQNAELRSALQVKDDALRLVMTGTIERAEVERFGIHMSEHECGCEVCQRTTLLCPATQSSIIQDIAIKALAAQPEGGAK